MHTLLLLLLFFLLLPGAMTAQKFERTLVPGGDITKLFHYHDTLYMLNGPVFQSFNGGESWSRTGPSNSITYNGFVAKGDTIIAYGSAPDVSIDRGKTWERGEIYSGTFFDIAVIGDWFVSGNKAGIHRSKDGKGWEAVYTGTSQFDKADYRRIVRLDTSLIVLKGAREILRSNDSGATWKSGFDALSVSKIFDLIPYRDMIIAVGTSNRFFASFDHGFRWHEIETTMIPNGQVYSITVDGNRLIAAAEGGVYISTDSARSWIPMAGAPGHQRVNQVIRVNDTLYAATRGDVYRSVDDGATWQAIHNGLRTIQINDLVVDHQPDQDVLYIASVYGPYVSYDTGYTWIPTGKGVLGDAILLCLDISDDLLLAGSTDLGIYSSTDRGRTWQKSDHNADTLTVRDVLITDFGLFAAADRETGPDFSRSRGGTLRSLDGGISWTALRGPGASSAATALLLVEDTLFSGSLVINRSTDHGESWQIVAQPGYSTQAFLYHNDMIFAGGMYPYVWISRDKGVNWTPSIEGLESSDDVLSLYGDDELVVAGTVDKGLFYSRDNGNSWKLAYEFQGFAPDYHAIVRVGDTLLCPISLYASQWAGAGQGIERIPIAPLVAGYNASSGQHTLTFLDPFSTSLHGLLPVSYEGTRGRPVRIELYNSLGRRSIQLEFRTTNAGANRTELNVSGLSGGFYFCRIECDGEVIMQKVLVGN